MVYRPQDRLVGFARVLTDHVFVGLALDLVVEPEACGLDLGALLMDAIVTHPMLAGAKSLELVCQPETAELDGHEVVCGRGSRSCGGPYVLRQAERRWVV